MDDDASNLSTFDIYSDLLLERQAPGVSVEQLEKTNAENKTTIEELSNQLKTLQTQNKAIVEENKILKTNISELFKTAQAELRRKDRQLEEQYDRRQGYWRESDYRGSINDRLRDLKNHPREHPRRTNGVDYRSSRRDTDMRTDRSSERRSADVRKPDEAACEDKASRSKTEARCDHMRNETVSATESKQTVCEEETRDSHGDHCGDKHLEKRASTKDSDNLSIHSDSQSIKEIKICIINNERSDCERIPNRQSLSSYRIPKKSSTCKRSSYDPPLSGKEETGRETSSELMTSDRRVTDSKRSSHRLTYSPSRYKRGSDTDEVHRISSHNQKHDRSSERSKSREKSSRYSDRNASRSSAERYSGRKRRRSPERRSPTQRDSGQDYKSHYSAPQKKYKKDSTAGANEKDHRDRSSDGSKLWKQEGLKSHKNDGSPGTEKSTEVTHKKRHRSSKTSSHKKKYTEASLVEGEEHARKRHKSDRKNKSLKRAKETLHKMHSTPKKHKKHKKEESTKHKSRKRHGSKKNKNKEKTQDEEDVVYSDSFARSVSGKVLQRTLEEEQIPGIRDFDFDGEEGKEQNDVGEVWQDVCTEAPCTDLQESTTDEIVIRKEHSEQDSATYRESHIKVVIPEIAGKRNSGENVDTSDQYSSQCGLIPGVELVELESDQTEISTNFETRKTCLVTVDQPETSPLNQNSESLLIQESQADLIDAENHTERKGVEKYDGPGNDTEVGAGNSTLQIVKEMSSLRQPDTDSCGYSSEHETILVCASASQEDDSESESDLQTVSAAFCSPRTESKHETLQSEGKSSALTLHGHYISYSEDEMAMLNSNELRIDTSGSQSQEQLENVCESDNKQEVSAGSKSELEQSKSNLIHQQTKSVNSQDDQSTNVTSVMLKSVQSSIGNTSDSFPERILAVFGSNSFLESDDLESSKEAQASLVKNTDSFSLHPEDSKPCSVLSNSGGDSACASEAQNKNSSFAETLLNIFGSNSFLGSDDLDSRQGVACGVSEINVKFEGEQNVESLQSNSTATTNIPDNAEEKQPTTKEKTKVGNLTDTVLDIFGSSSLIEDDNQDEDKTTSPQPVSDLITQSEESISGVPPSSFAIISTKVETDEIVLSPSGFVLKHDHKYVPTAESGELLGESPRQQCLPELVDVADISINTPSVDALSCSASPTHESLLGDSENSCQSSQCDQNDNESEIGQGDSGNSEQDSPSDQDIHSETADPQENDTQSGMKNLSDGEIVSSSSDSEIAPRFQTSMRRSDRKDSRSKPKESKSSRNRSRSRDRKRPRSRDKQPSSLKDRRKQSRDRVGERRDRDEFFKEKMRIFNERQAAQEATERKHTYPGSKPKRDISHDSRSVTRNRLQARDRRSYTDEKNVRCTQEHKDRHWTKTDQRSRERRPVDDAGVSSRHSSQAHGARRHDTDKHGRTLKKPEREKLTTEEKERDKRRGHKR